MLSLCRRHALSMLQVLYNLGTVDLLLVCQVAYNEYVGASSGTQLLAKKGKHST